MCFLKWCHAVDARLGRTAGCLALAAFVACSHHASLTLVVKPNPIAVFGYAPGHGALAIVARLELTIINTGGVGARVDTVTIRVLDSRSRDEVVTAVWTGPLLARPNGEPQNRVPAIGSLTLGMDLFFPPSVTTIPAGLTFAITVDAFDDNSHHVSATLEVPQAP